MLRKDEFIKQLSNVNSGTFLLDKVTELEKFVDEELIKAENILNMINTNTQGSSSGSIETVTSLEPTYAVHTDSSVIGGAAGTSGNGKKIWTDELKYTSGASAVTTPWVNLTTDQTTFDGKLKITLPDGTNKNVAKMLADKYMDTTVNANTPVGGFWGSGNVIVQWDSSANRLYMIFKLF